MINSVFAKQFCIIVDDSAVITQHHSKKNQVYVGNKFGYGFMRGCKYNSFVEIIKNNKTVGWIEEKYILCSEDIGRSPYIDAIKVKTIDGRDSMSMSYKKSFIINTPKYSSATNINITSLDSSFCEIFFVLKESKDRLLLSSVTTIFSDSYTYNMANNIAGWVDKKYLKEWNSREAIEPIREKFPIYLDRNFKELYIGKLRKLKKYFNPRYPILEYIPNGIKISNMQGMELYIHNRNRKNYKKVILTESDFVDELASAYTTMARTISRFKSNRQGMKRLRNGLGKAIETLTGQEIQKDDNIADFLEENLKIPKSEILNLTFYDWVDEIARNRNDYRAKVIRKFRKNAVFLKALTAEKIYENITFDKQNEVAYKERQDKNGNAIIRKTKFNISVVDKTNFGQSNSYKRKWIWIPFEYLP